LAFSPPDAKIQANAEIPIVKQLITKLLLLLVRGYQLFLSPIMGQNCRFYPTCSSYTMEAIELHGPLKGLWYGLKRIGRCHPGSDGGIDPVPGTEDQYQLEDPCCSADNPARD